MEHVSALLSSIPGQLQDGSSGSSSNSSGSSAGVAFGVSSSGILPSDACSSLNSSVHSTSTGEGQQKQHGGGGGGGYGGGGNTTEPAAVVPVHQDMGTTLKLNQQQQQSQMVSSLATRGDNGNRAAVAAAAQFPLAPMDPHKAAGLTLSGLGGASVGPVSEAGAAGGYGGVASVTGYIMTGLKNSFGGFFRSSSHAGSDQQELPAPAQAQAVSMSHTQHSSSSSSSSRMSTGDHNRFSVGGMIVLDGAASPMYSRGNDCDDDGMMVCDSPLVV